MIEFRVEIFLNTVPLLGILCAGVGLTWLAASAVRRLSASPKGVVIEVSSTKSKGKESEDSHPRVSIWRPLAVMIVGLALAAVSYLYYDRQIDRAWQDYEKAVVNHDHDSGELDKAIKAYLEAISDSIPLHHSNYYWMRGMAYKSMGHLNEAIEDFDKALGIEPGSPLIYLDRGSVHHRKGVYRKAVEDYSMALELGLPSGEASQAYMNRGSAFEGLDQLDKARQDFDKAIELNPESPFTYLVRGTFHLRKGDPGEAIEDYDMTLELGLHPPGTYQAYTGRGTAYSELGQMERASQDFESAEVLR